MIEDRSENAIELEVNEQYADAYIKALRAIGERYALADDITVSSLIGNNEIFTARRHEMDD